MGIRRFWQTSVANRNMGLPFIFRFMRFLPTNAMIVGMESLAKGISLSKMHLSAEKL
jgi:hypothetical protein